MVLSIGSQIKVQGYTEIHTITSVIAGFGYMTSYTAMFEGRHVNMDGLYVPFKFVLAI